MAAAGLAAALLLGACGGGAGPARAGGARVAGVAPLSQVLVMPGQTLRAGEQQGLAVPFRPPWAVSFDVRGAAGSRLEAILGPARVDVAGTGRWRHVEFAAGRLWVDQHPATALPRRGAPGFELAAQGGRVAVRALIVSGAGDRGALLLHRLAELHARLAPGQFPIGASAGDRLYDSSSYWTSGFWPGALWQAAGLSSGARLFGAWALAATLAHVGHERDDTHDVGFMYGQSSLAAWRMLCDAPGQPVRAGLSAAGPGVCARLRRSALSAADELVALARSNAPAGTIPTRGHGRVAVTIVDSLMNAAALLPWASATTGRPVYGQVARRHAERVTALLVRRDGSTAQAANFDRNSGRLLSIGTHQGLSATSTWSRGEGWALYGLAWLAQQLHDRRLLQVALRVGGYVARRDPSGAVPPWDYDAAAGAPRDVSAGAITAAGLLHLASACRTLRASCGRGAASWRALAGRMLASVLAHASARPPLGLLGGQILNEHGTGCWCNGGELSFGLAYALEALNLEHG